LSVLLPAFPASPGSGQRPTPPRPLRQPSEKVSHLRPTVNLTVSHFTQHRVHVLNIVCIHVEMSRSEAGHQGGKARAAKMTGAELTARARLADDARWAGRRWEWEQGLAAMTEAEQQPTGPTKDTLGEAGPFSGNSYPTEQLTHHLHCSVEPPGFDGLPVRRLPSSTMKASGFLVVISRRVGD